MARGHKGRRPPNGGCGGQQAQASPPATPRGETTPRNDTPKSARGRIGVNVQALRMLDVKASTGAQRPDRLVKRVAETQDLCDSLRETLRVAEEVRSKLLEAGGDIDYVRDRGMPTVPEDGFVASAASRTQRLVTSADDLRARLLEVERLLAESSPQEGAGGKEERSEVRELLGVAEELRGRLTEVERLMAEANGLDAAVSQATGSLSDIQDPPRSWPSVLQLSALAVARDPLKCWSRGDEDIQEAVEGQPVLKVFDDRDTRYPVEVRQQRSSTKSPVEIGTLRSRLLASVREDDGPTVLDFIAEGADTTLMGEALRLGAHNGSFCVVKELVSIGLSVNEPCPDTRFTPLHLASANGHSTVVEVLLDALADASLESCGVAPLTLARSAGHVEVVEVIQAHLDSLKETGEDGTAPDRRAFVLPRVSSGLSRAVEAEAPRVAERSQAQVSDTSGAPSTRGSTSGA